MSTQTDLLPLAVTYDVEPLSCVGGQQFLVRFPNGYGVSLMRSSCTHASPGGWEVAVAVWNRSDRARWTVVPVEGITDEWGITVCETAGETADLLATLSRLPEPAWEPSRFRSLRAKGWTPREAFRRVLAEPRRQRGGRDGRDREAHGEGRDMRHVWARGSADPEVRHGVESRRPDAGRVAAEELPRLWWLARARLGSHGREGLLSPRLLSWRSRTVTGGRGPRTEPPNSNGDSNERGQARPGVGGL